MEALIAQYGGIFTPFLIVMYMIGQWVIVPLINKATKPVSHGDLHDKMRECENRIMTKMSAIQHDTDWLREVHDRRDEDGVFVWYNKRSVEAGLWELITVMKDVSKDLKKYLESDKP